MARGLEREIGAQGRDGAIHATALPIRIRIGRVWAIADAVMGARLAAAPLRTGMVHCADARFARMAKQFGMKIVTLVSLLFLHFHGNAVRLGPCVLPDAGHLPGDFHIWLVGADGESIVADPEA
jgi:hypothetical protein